MNKMKEVAELLGVELNEEFVVSGEIGKYKITKDGLMFLWAGVWTKSIMGFNFLFDHEIKKPILNRQEKQYLENVLRPFKDRTIIIKKIVAGCRDEKEFICINITNGAVICFPYFEKGKMYKGMQAEKPYTLEELELFEDEQE